MHNLTQNKHNNNLIIIILIWKIKLLSICHWTSDSIFVTWIWRCIWQYELVPYLGSLFVVVLWGFMNVVGPRVVSQLVWFDGFVNWILWDLDWAIGCKCVHYNEWRLFLVLMEFCLAINGLRLFYFIFLFFLGKRQSIIIQLTGKLKTTKWEMSNGTNFIQRLTKEKTT